MRYSHIAGVILFLLTLPFSADAFPSGKVLGFPASSYVFPIMSPRLSSKFGMRNHPKLNIVRHHSGIDLAAPEGSLIRAIAGGTVIFSDPYAGYGNLIVIKHPNGFTSHYGHCFLSKVSPGKIIKAGEIIGTVGQTGITTGPHLHFEIRKDGTALNPELFIPGLTVEAKG